MHQADFDFPAPTSAAAATAEPAAANANAGAIHAALPRATAQGADPVGFAIGWDHARHRVLPPLAHLDAGNPVGQGYGAGRAAFGERRLASSAAVRQWLALRLKAWLAGEAFDDPQVNPRFLDSLDSTHCPVRRVPLLLATGGDDDATVTRLNPGAAYAAGNLAVLSRSAAAALARPGAATGAPPQAEAPQAQANASQAQADGPPALADASAQLRLQVLASFATPLPHARAAALPLVVLPPNRVRVLNPVQALQVMLTLQFTQAGYARRLLSIAALVPGSEARQAFLVFMHTLLARRLVAGPAPAAAVLRQALEDSWTDALVQRRWQRLALRLDAADCERLLQRASQRGLVVGGGRWISSDAAVEAWQLPAAAGASAASAAAAPSASADAGSATPAASAAAERRPARPAVAGAGAALANRRRPGALRVDQKPLAVAGTPALPRPGSARNRGSQNAASCAGLTQSGSRQ